MHRKFIALIISAALAVTSLTAVPAQAQNRGETAAIIAGVAALAIVGAAIADDRNKDRRNDHVTRGHGYHKPYYAPKRQHKQVYRYGHKQQRHYKPQRGFGWSHQGRPVYQRGYRNHVPYHRDNHRN